MKQQSQRKQYNQNSSKPKQNTFRPISNKFIFQKPYIPIEEEKIIKLTAQFVATNGNEFLDQLYHLKKSDSRFQFIEKTHPYNSYFEALIKMYSQIIHPKKDYTNLLIT